MKSTTALLQDSTISSALNFCFCVFCRNLKEKDHIKININSKKSNGYIGNQYYYYYYLGLPKIRIGRARTTKN